MSITRDLVFQFYRNTCISFPSFVLFNIFSFSFLVIYRVTIDRTNVRCMIQKNVISKYTEI